MVDVSRLRFQRKGVGIVLSPLEEDVLRILWERRESRVRDIYGVLRKRKRIALTSVAVSLDRLHKKQAVGRRIELGRGGPHYIYFRKVSKPDFEKSIVDAAVNKLIHAFGDVAVTYFDERFGKPTSDTETPAFDTYSKGEERNSRGEKRGEKK